MVSENEISEDGQQVEFDVDRHTLEELLDTANKARSRGATVLFRGLRVHSVNEVLQLAAAGGRWQGLVWVS